MSLKPRKRFSITLHPLTPVHKLVHRYVIKHVRCIDRWHKKNRLGSLAVCKFDFNVSRYGLAIYAPFMPIRIKYKIYARVSADTYHENSTSS